MCLLTTSTIRTLKAVFLGTNGLIADVYASNSDGLGVMYSDGRKLHVHKVLPRNAEEARQFIESLPDSDHMIACHWRMKTHGLIDMANCHPYRVNNDTYLAHNGVLHTGNAADPEKSDTWHFIEDYLSTLPTDALHDPKFIGLLGEFIRNNRFAIMSADGRLSVVNREQGVEVEGIWFSNTYAWTPSMLIPEYRKPQPASLYPYQGWSFNRQGYQDLWDEEDELAEDYTQIESDVYDALVNCDEDALGDVFKRSPYSAVNCVLNDFEIKLFRTTDLESLPRYDHALVTAWVEADDDYLTRKCKTDPKGVARALLYFCDYNLVYENTPADE